MHSSLAEHACSLSVLHDPQWPACSSPATATGEQAVSREARGHLVTDTAFTHATSIRHGAAAVSVGQRVRVLRVCHLHDSGSEPDTSPLPRQVQ